MFFKHLCYVKFVGKKVKYVSDNSLNETSRKIQTKFCCPKRCSRMFIGIARYPLLILGCLFRFPRSTLNFHSTIVSNVLSPSLHRIGRRSISLMIFATMSLGLSDKLGLLYQVRRSAFF